VVGRSTVAFRDLRLTLRYASTPRMMMVDMKAPDGLNQQFTQERIISARDIKSQ
jgi:hypothetical protein